MAKKKEKQLVTVDMDWLLESMMRMLASHNKQLELSQKAHSQTADCILTINKRLDALETSISHHLPSHHSQKKLEEG